MNSKNLRIVLMLTLLVSLVSFAAAQSGTRAARFNYQTGQTLTGNGIDALTNTAARQPGLRMLLDEQLGQGWQGNCEIVNQWNVPVGTEFINSGLDRNGVPCQWRQRAREPFTAVQVRNKISNKVTIIKSNCLNPVNRVGSVPLVQRELVETSNSSEVDVDVNMEVNIDFKPTVVANATASTAPINIVFNMQTPQAAPMMMGGGPINQFMIVRDSRGLLSFGGTVGAKGTSICINNSVNSVNNNTNNNTNNNSNSNSNSNSNVVNVGG